MKNPAARVVLSIAAVVVVAFGAFIASVAVWGAWWRFSHMPTAEEWSAIFGASALIALGFAWYQIRQVDNSNKALIASNELARQVNVEAVRPRVQVALEPTRFVRKNRGAAVEGVLHIAVRNIGVSPAHDVRLRVSPPFTSLEKFFKPGMMDVHFAEVNETFNGDISFQSLNPGHTYIWFLGHAPDLFDDSSGVPRRWEVEVEYTGTQALEPFQEKFVLDLDIEKRIELPVDSLERIGKDIEVVGNKLEAIKRAIPRKLAYPEDSSVMDRDPRNKTQSSGIGAAQVPFRFRKQR